MDQIFLQAKIIIISFLGVVAIIPGPDRKGNLRIKGPLNIIISYLGIVFLIVPWFIVPFLAQPRFVGIAEKIMMITGFGLCLAGAILCALSLKMILPAFKEQYSEFTPAHLVKEGPYWYVRHPLYLSCLMILSGIYTIFGAAFSIIYIPLCYFLFRLVTIYEEKRILIPKFSTEYITYKKQVRSAIFGIWGGLVFAVLYILLVGICVGSLMNIAGLQFIN